MKEFVILYTVKICAFIIRCLPMSISLWIGRVIGTIAYYFDFKHKSQAYANIKMAFSESKTPDEVKTITKNLFKNYGQNLIELFRMPLIKPDEFEKIINVVGKENVIESLKKGKGVILLAMHFGSWELASMSCAMLGYPYKVFVKPQNKYSKLDDLLNSYRECGGSLILSRGMGTRDFLRSLQNNEVVGMVVDQGGKDGVLVPFFNRQASMSVGAIRMGLKWEVPLCFSIIIREKGGKHKMIINEPLDLENTGDVEKDVVTNLNKITKIMEDYICKYPSEYMWFYKIWKYSKEANVTILNDGRTGHLRQSQTVAKTLQELLTERGIKSSLNTVDVFFKNKFCSKIFPIIGYLANPFFCQGRLQILKWMLKKESFKEVMSKKSDFLISCGSALSGVNYLLSQDHNSKSIVILRPGLFKYKRFDLVILPQHDASTKEKNFPQVAVTHAAPNLINQEYLEEQSIKLLNRFSHLKGRVRFKIGVFIGGDSKNVFLSQDQIKVLVHQIKEVSQAINADILVTTSRRTPSRIEQFLYKELKKYPKCPLLILANQDDIPEAVGGILGLSDIVVVSGDSISMISEAASSGKYTVVFSPQKREVLLRGSNKHSHFIEKLNEQGFILSSNVKDISQSIYGIAKNKIQTKKIDDNEIIREALRYII